MQIIQFVAFNKDVDELLYRLSTQGIESPQLNVNEHERTPPVSILSLLGSRKKQHNRRSSYM
jgi:hypothetical protein